MSNMYDPCVGYEDIFQQYPDMLSPDDDPFSGFNILMAERAIERYETENERRYGESTIYPVPDFLNKLACSYCHCNYCLLEQRVGRLFIDLFGFTLDLLPLRCYCVALLSRKKNPLKTSPRIRKGIDNYNAYIMGFVPEDEKHVRPTTNRPITVVQYPWIFNEFINLDSSFETFDVEKVKDNLKEEWDYNFPFLTAQRMFDYMRSLRSKKRMKVLKERSG